MANYLFKSSRLGFRNWTEKDIVPMSKINADKNVMEYFPSTQNQKQTEDFIKRMQQSFSEYGYCYFAVEILETGELIGFIGLSYQNYKADFTPCVDIGWRLKTSAWGNGFATEGAKACLNYGFHQLNLKSIVAIAPELNLKSQQVMKKIGMTKNGVFLHPSIDEENALKPCVLFKSLN